ncbi:folliculin-interacting protein 2 [Zophobas morio]|uniref:folliculin-interacting protein 2 n=1 Tax=Zophobas morio TaxID=2755281 RepID=UPI0030827C4E
MALFNKLFSNRRGIHNKHQDNVSEKFFAFSKDQVRVVLFRECDFRGRKLLFDSNSVKKVPINVTKSGEPIRTAETEKFSEVCNGYGYVYTKPEADFSQLAEMVFGSVAMSFRGTYFKMHTLESPNRLMFSQVFSSPRFTSHSRVSVSSRSDPHSLEHSKLDDSGASSTNSISEHLSVHSTASDTVLVCRRPHSAPLDVPVMSSVSLSIPSLNGDSGYGTGFSCINGPSSTWGSILDEKGASTLSLSSSSLYKKWLRRTSTSLENSGHSLATCGSIQEGCHRHHRSSKLGLTLILQLTPGQEEEISQFLMEHVSLLDAILWRARQVVEIAFIKSQNFTSLMAEMAHFSAQYLVNLLSGSYLSMNLWLSLSNGCDNYNSISAFNASDSDKTASVFSPELCESQKADLNSSNSSASLCSSGLFKETENSGDFHLFSFARFLKTDPFNIKKNLFGENRTITAEKFVQDFCELLEDVDIKNTNFFMSTLLTAVLTYHLGWVNTCLPASSDAVLQSRHPFNPLWGELSDLYGAVGHPTKIAQTIITGSNKKDLISKILLSMTYFIRCCDVERRIPIRSDIYEENQIVEKICRKHSCIPKENYKKYEDHLKEIMNSNKDFFAKANNSDNIHNYCQNREVDASLTTPNPLLKKSTGLAKTQTCLGDLSKLAENDASNCLYPNITTDYSSQSELVTTLYPKLNTSETTEEHMYPSNDEIKKKVNTLCRVPNSAVLCHMEKQKDCAVIQEMTQPHVVNMEKQMRSTDFKTGMQQSDPVSDCNENRNVVFVLGDDERLIGIKKDYKVIEKQPEITNAKKRRPSYLDLSKQIYKSETMSFQDSDFVENSDKSKVKASTSWSSVAEKEIREQNEAAETSRSSYSKKYPRAQSEPPEERQPEDSNRKAKYRYSGVKFSLQQYPQILSNYMKSKNVEITNLQFGDKSLKLDELSSLSETIISKYPELDEEYEDGEALQTPSNASELEFTSDLFVAPLSAKQTKESNVDLQSGSSGNQNIPNTITEELNENCDDHKTARKISSCSIHKMKVANLPMPKSKFYKSLNSSLKYTSSLMRATSDSYMPDMVLQGPIVPKQEWETRLKSDLALASQHSLIDQPVEEAVAVIANIDTWEVQLMSSHTFLIDKGSTGIRIGMSQLVSNMLESLLQMWKLKVPPHFCLMHIEQTLQELCIRSKALSELLLATEFCNMEQLTSALQLEVNDVPLLLAVASTHSPQVTQKYGLSFQ